ncbi:MULTISPECIES: hypothetical protein [Methylosinus]|uniref:hypothetical protein n=1 Tax=Methylosinus TaxID=425 RepID=UPI0001D2F3D6|nr:MULTISPECIES: hypothetical protein [Methylosinus]OBS52070.1 hypothetical protein A8B73_12905 [Methylosinus sp. 3S-1]
MIRLHALILPIAAVTISFAAAPALAGGTSEQRSACMSDAFKFCSGDIPDETAIESCLRRNSRSLSSACQMVMGVPAPGEATTRRASRSITPPAYAQPAEAPDALPAAVASAADPTVADDERPTRRRHYSRHHRRHVAYAQHRRHHRHHGSGSGFGGLGELASMAGPAMAFMPMVTKMFEDNGPSFGDDDD